MSDISEAGCIQEYVRDTLELVLRKRDLHEDDSSLFYKAKRTGVWHIPPELQERILMRGAMLGCVPRFPAFNLEGDAFWDAMAPLQREKSSELKCTLRTEKNFSANSCPCYVCGGKCLRRLYGRDSVPKASDASRGYLQWERGHIVPQSCGKNDNLYNLRIMCMDCNRASGSIFPSIYALSILPLDVTTLATEDNVRSILDLLKMHFEE